jgi:hypothetical protein
MSLTNRTFSIRNGLDVANTIIVTNTSGVINVSNIQWMNAVNVNVSNNFYTGNIWLNPGNLAIITGVTWMNLDTGIIQTNSTNMVVQTIVSSNQNVVLSANGTANATLSNTGNLTLSSGNLVTTYNVVTGNLIATNPIAQFANSGVYVAGTLVANNPNINFVAANTSNLSITGTSNTSPGNVTITFDTRVPPGTGGGGSVNAYANVGLVASSLDNIVWLNTQSVLVTVTQNASETHGVNVTAIVNSTLNLTSLNVTTLTTTGGAANQEIIFNNAGTLQGQANLTYNVAANAMSLEGNVVLSNATSIGFGGNFANSANGQFYILWNSSSSSLDFTFQ